MLPVSGPGLLRTLPDAVFVIASALALAIPRAAAAQTGANVLVVINHASSASETIGRRYAERRGVPEHNLCVLQLPLDESVNREVYDTQIEQPIWSCIANLQAQDRILYIVLTKDVPIRISGYRRAIGHHRERGFGADAALPEPPGRRVGSGGRLNYPILTLPVATAADRGSSPFTQSRARHLPGHAARRFSLQDDAQALIDRGRRRPQVRTAAVLDQKASRWANRVGDRWLGAAADRLTRVWARRSCRAEPSQATAGGPSGLAIVGYYSWGSNDPQAITSVPRPRVLVRVRLAACSSAPTAGRSRSRRRLATRATALAEARFRRKFPNRSRPT